MASDSPKRRPRRKFSEEFKEQAARLVLDEGKSMAAVAPEFDLVRPRYANGSNGPAPIAGAARPA
jgi:hypothetical protein